MIELARNAYLLKLIKQASERPARMDGLIRFLQWIFIRHSPPIILYCKPRLMALICCKTIGGKWTFETRPTTACQFLCGIAPCTQRDEKERPTTKWQRLDHSPCIPCQDYRYPTQSRIHDSSTSLWLLLVGPVSTMTMFSSSSLC
jgi:hypothetical protein